MTYRELGDLRDSVESVLDERFRVALHLLRREELVDLRRNTAWLPSSECVCWLWPTRAEERLRGMSRRKGNKLGKREKEWRSVARGREGGPGSIGKYLLDERANGGDDLVVTFLLREVLGVHSLKTKRNATQKKKFQARENFGGRRQRS